MQKKASDISGSAQPEWTEIWMARTLLHNIGNIFTNFVALVDLLQDRLTDEEKELFNILFLHIQNTLRNGQTFLSGFTEYPKQNFCVFCTTRNVLQLYHVEAKNQQIQKHFFCQKKCFIYGNQNLYEQILSNLVRNSIDALRQKSSDQMKMIKILILVDSYRNTQVIVKDNGPGIKNENIKNILLPGFSTKPYGTGLGLTFAYRHCQNHFHALWQLTSTSQGTTLKLTFPRPPHVATIAACQCNGNNSGIDSPIGNTKK